MDGHCSDSDSSASDHSKDLPPLFSRDGNQPEDTFQWKLEDELKRSIEELQSGFDRNHQPLIDLLKELNKATDELESMHKNTTVGSLVGSSIGAVGGIASIAGVCLAPFTFGASLALTAAGAAAGVAGGVTGATSNITNMVKQKNLRETFKKIIKDFLNRINPMIELMGKIENITKKMDLLTLKTLNMHVLHSAARGAEDILKIASVASLAQIGKMCAKGAKEIRVYVKAVHAARGPAGAAKAVRAVAGAAKEIRVTAALTGAVSAMFVVFDVCCIVQDSLELSEMNQPADKRKAEEIKSETLKFILQMRETAAQFKKIVDKIKDTIDSFYLFRC